ncbi:MAG TPA: acyltransferase [Solirubrobacteraceae bacterium]|nr:acyltransferase [Solirubrobacteraceae bacterium]
MSALSKNIAPAPTPPSSSGRGRGRIREVDGYRAIAAVLIVIFHAWSVGNEPYRGTAFELIIESSQFAVSLFFALSGFVILLPLVRGALTGKVPSGRSFLVRRLYRLLPLYFVVIILVWASRFAGTPQDFADLIRHLTFTEVYDKKHLFWLLGPAWSLADEFHYYVLVAVLGPPLARVAARRRTVAGRLAVMATMPLLLLVASLTYTTIVTYGMHIPWSDYWVYFNPLARADSFAEGMLLAVLLGIPGAMEVRRWPSRLLTAAGMALLGSLWLISTHLQAATAYYFTIAGIGSVMLLGGAAMMDSRQLLSRALRWGPFQLLATIGYSMYLVHEPVMIQLARWHLLNFDDPIAWPLSTIALIGVSAVVSWVTYRVIERPGVELQGLLGDLRQRQRRRPVRRAGPPPRWLPDVTLATVDGAPVALRDLPRDRPVLFGLDTDGERGLAEQRFRLDAGEADGFFVAPARDTPGPPGATVLVDTGRRLTDALNGAAGLIEVSPGGLITATIDYRHAPAGGAGTEATSGGAVG